MTDMFPPDDAPPPPLTHDSSSIEATVTTESDAKITVSRTYSDCDGSICITSGYSARGLKIRLTRVDARLLIDALGTIFDL